MLVIKNKNILKPNRRKALKPYLYFLIACIFTCNIGSAQSFNYQRDFETILKRTQQKGDSFEYKRLLPRFLKNDQTMTVFEMLALMIGYTGLPEYRPFEHVKIERQILHLNDSAKYIEAIRTCDTFLKRHPLNQAAIIEKAYAFYQLKQQDSSAFYKQQFGRIMAAMDWSADGRSPDNAMFAIGPEDGKNFADKYYHADVVDTKTIINKYGDYCSAVQMKYKKDGKMNEIVFYFELQHAANTTSKKDTPKIKEKP